MNVAIIENSIVTNIVVGNVEILKSMFKAPIQVVNIDNYSVGIGDKCVNGEFYRGTTRIDDNTTQMQYIQKEASGNTQDKLQILLENGLITQLEFEEFATALLQKERTDENA